MNPPAADTRPAVARSASGFTLIEVLAALVIVALGMLGAIEAVTTQARNGTYLREKTLAHWIAMNVVTEQRLQPAPPAVAESSDDVEFAGQHWHWTMRVSQTQVQTLRRIDVSVRHAESPDGVALATVSGFYGSAIAPAGGGTLSWSSPLGGTPGGDQGGAGSDGETANPPTKKPPGTRPPKVPPVQED
jgi:general secretion pathway protein I